MKEKRFRRKYGRTFDFFKLNCLMLSDVLSTTKEKAAARAIKRLQHSRTEALRLTKQQRIKA